MGEMRIMAGDAMNNLGYVQTDLNVLFISQECLRDLKALVPAHVSYGCDFSILLGHNILFYSNNFLHKTSRIKHDQYLIWRTSFARAVLCITSSSCCPGLHK